jgi:alanine racemase
MAVIKADAYSHGDSHVASALSECGVKLFAVSNIDEAVGLREQGIKGEILILGYSAPSYAETLAKYDLTQAIVSAEYAEQLAISKYHPKCQFAIDTGMNRIGLNADNVDECEEIIRQYYHRLIITGIFTHLCVADSDDYEDVVFTHGQISKFNALASCLSDLHLPFVHCLNSAGGLHYFGESPMSLEEKRIVRLGIVLYGLKPDRGFIIPKEIKPALTWKSVVSMVKKVQPGEAIGYGRSFIVEHPMTVATVTTGYADGFSRHLSNGGFVIIRGQMAPVVGRVCMDQTMVDVSYIEGVKMGDRVVLLGTQGDLTYTADDMAELLGTIGYEVICNISKRVQRYYVNSN